MHSRTELAHRESTKNQGTCWEILPDSLLLLHFSQFADKHCPDSTSRNRPDRRRVPGHDSVDQLLWRNRDRECGHSPAPTRLAPPRLCLHAAVHMFPRLHTPVACGPVLVAVPSASSSSKLQTLAASYAPAVKPLYVFFSAFG